MLSCHTKNTFKRLSLSWKTLWKNQAIWLVQKILGPKLKNQAVTWNDRINLLILWKPTHTQKISFRNDWINLLHLWFPNYKQKNWLHNSTHCWDKANYLPSLYACTRMPELPEPTWSDLLYLLLLRMSGHG